MGSLRFGMIVVDAFAAAFGGVKWASHGFPIPMLGTVPLKLDARIPTFAQSVQKGTEEAWIDAKTEQSDGDSKRDTLRLAALQAANAYALSPCDSGIKANLVAALSDYAGAWAEMAGCGSGRCDGSDKKLDAARVAFSTPADMNVRKALRNAFAQGGISRADFRPEVGDWAATAAGGPGNPNSACSAGATPYQHGWRHTQRPVFHPPPVTATLNRARRPKPAYTNGSTPSDQPWAKNEQYNAPLRKMARKHVVDVFNLSWSSLCFGKNRRRMLGALDYYFGQRGQQLRVYQQHWGEPGVNYIKQAWATPEDSRVERLTREMYGRGYFKPDDVTSRARKLLQDTVQGEKITGHPCND